MRIIQNETYEGEIFVIMDWDLKYISGIEVAREIRGDRRFENTPILILTSEISEAELGMVSEVGVNGCLLKPFPAKVLVERIIGIMHQRMNPPEHVNLIKQGQDLLDKGMLDEALSLFNKSKDMKNRARIYVHIGEVHEVKEEYDEARNNYDRALTINPQYLKAYVVAAGMMIKLNDDDSALPYLEKAAEISPHNSNRQALLGNIYLSKGEEEKAHKAFKEAIRLDPSKGTEIGETYLKLGKTRMAEECFRSLLKSDKDNVHVYNRLGIALRRQGKWQESIEEYKKAINITEDDEALYFNMGKAYEDGGKMYNARDCFEKALKLNPKFTEAKEALKKLGK